MDYKKIILYLALAAVAFMLWNSWQQEHHKKTKAAQQQVVAKQEQASSVVPTAATVPTSTATALAKQQPASEVAKTPNDRIINVKTDVFDAQIDTKGGNLIKAGLVKYPVSSKTPNIPEVILSHDPEKYYVAQSGLTGAQGPDTSKGQVIYQSSKSSYVMQDGQKNLVVTLTWQNQQGLHVTKTFTFKRDDYAVKVAYTIKNSSNKPWTGQFYAQIRRKKPKSEGGLFHLHTYRGAAISSPDKHYEKISYKDMREQNLSRNIKGGWLAMQQRYFVSAWAPQQNQTSHFYTRAGANNVYTVGYLGPKLTVPAGSKLTTGSTFYTGPEVATRLDKVALHLALTIDYGWLAPISIAIFWVMQQIYKLVGNWGWAIVLVTLLIKLIFYKLSDTSYRSMAKMKLLAPKLKALKERYGDDKQKITQETMRLYKEEKANPISGCLPMIIQIPFFFALYYVLIEAVQLRQAPFIFWIHDLSVRDPYYILPIIMGLTMLVQQMLSPAPDKTQARIMYIMPVVFTVFFATFPAGLVLYWLVNNVLSVAQQWYVMKKVEKQKNAKKGKR